jgi:hypothetical protein
MRDANPGMYSGNPTESATDDPVDKTETAAYRDASRAFCSAGGQKVRSELEVDCTFCCQLRYSIFGSRACQEFEIGNWGISHIPIMVSEMDARCREDAKFNFGNWATEHGGWEWQGVAG